MIFDHPEYDRHAQITFVNDETTGLAAINAIHRDRGTTSGGGVRFRSYRSDAEALTDVLRLSRAMTYKMVLAGLPMGGAKSVIIGDPATDKTPDLLRAFGQFVESLNGRYTCGPDIGTDEIDMEAIAQVTSYVAGRSSQSGSTAPPTVVGVFNGLRATAEVALGRQDLDGVGVAIQGAGGVGSELTRLLVDAGAEVTVADVDHDAVRSLTDRFPMISVVPPDMLLSADVDILSPNAVGAVLNKDTIPTIMAKAVCGSANNQLATAADADALVEHDILWAPDYVVSAGGAIAGSCDVGAITVDQRNTGLDRIHQTTFEILARAKAQNVSTDGVARGMAQALLAEEI